MQERSIFMAALAHQAPDQRSAFLDEACSNDPALRERVEALLQSHVEAGVFLGKPVAERLAEQFGKPQGTAETQATQQLGDDDQALECLAPSDKPGSLGTLGHYEIQDVIGRGGMGIVLRAFDERLHRVVAIKVMAAQLATSAAARKRFIREARAAAAVSHDHIVTIHAVEEANGLPYIAMQFVAGMSLQQRLDNSGSLELREIVRIGMQTAGGLAAAHAQGLIHRDIKPANILLENGVERVKITDFGLARAIADASMTQTGMVAGTPQFMSPEQARGESVDRRSDLFSLGSVLYAMCTGRPPFHGDSAVAVLKRVCDDTPRPIRETNPDIPEWLDAIVARLQAKEPAERYQTATEVAELLNEHLAHLQHPSGVPLPAVTVASAQRSVPHKIRRLWATAAVVLLFVAAGLGLTEAAGVTKFTASVLRVLTPDGTPIVAVDDPGVQVTVPKSLAQPLHPQQAIASAAKKWNGLHIGLGAKASWPDDGESIVFSKMPMGTGILRYDFATQTTTEVHTTGKSASYAPGPSGRIAFVLGHGSREQVWLLEGDVSRKIADGGYPSWRPDGQSVVWMERSYPSLLALDTQATVPQTIELGKLPGNASWYPFFTQDGRWVAYQSGGKIRVMNLEDGTMKAWSFPNGRVPKGFIGSWHPGGKLLAFGSYGDGENYGSWVVNTETGECRGLISGDATMPVWSPNGARLAIDIRHESQAYEIWVFDAPAWDDLGPSVIEGGDVVRSKLEAAPGTTVPPLAQPFVVLGGKGVAERRFETLAEAVLNASEGDTIEVRGNGPFVTQSIQIGKQALTIRAGAGFRPVIRFVQGNGAPADHLLGSDGPLVLEGLEFERMPQNIPPDAEMTQSYLHGIGIYSAAPVCEIRNCEVLGQTGTSFNPDLQSGQRFLVDNCLQTTCGISFHYSHLWDAQEPPSIQMTRNTCIATDALTFWLAFDRALDLAGVDRRAMLRVEFEGNVFDATTFVNVNQFSSELVRAPSDAQALIAQGVGWYGQRNLFAVDGPFLALTAVASEKSFEPVRALPSLADWKRFSKSAEADSIQGRVHYQGGDLRTKLRDAPEKLTPEDFRLRPDSSGYRASKEGKDLGTDVDLVGPGPAYERWKKTPEYQQWLKDTGQPKNVTTTELTPEARERASADVFLRKGGTVALWRTQTQEPLLLDKPDQPWPAGNWHVVEVNAIRLATITLDDLGRLRDFPRLAEVCLSGSPVTTAALLDQIEGRPMAALILNGVPTTASDVARLARMTTLTRLYIYGADLFDDDIAPLADLPLLNDLNLEGTRITDRSLEQLGRRLKLKRFFLTGTNVTDVGLTALCQCKTLRHLDLSRTRVTADGVANLRKALPECEVVWAPKAGHVPPDEPRTAEPRVPRSDP